MGGFVRICLCVCVYAFIWYWRLKIIPMGCISPNMQTQIAFIFWFHPCPSSFFSLVVLLPLSVLVSVQVRVYYSADNAHNSYNKIVINSIHWVFSHAKRFEYVHWNGIKSNSNRACEYNTLSKCIAYHKTMWIKQCLYIAEYPQYTTFHWLYRSIDMTCYVNRK